MKRLIALAVLVSVTVITFTSCDRDVSPGSSSDTVSVAPPSLSPSSAPTSSIKSESSSANTAPKVETVTLEKSDIANDVADIAKVRIYLGAAHGNRVEQDLTKDELEEFKKLFDEMEMTARVNSVSQPGGGSMGGIDLFNNEGGLLANFSPDIHGIILNRMNGSIYVTKGGDEMMNFIWGLDIFADSELKARYVNEYIDSQERNKIPTTLERMTE